MSATASNVECTDCGAPLEASSQGTERPCPSCGSVKRMVKMIASGMQPSGHLLDKFVAHKLSLLTECGCPELLFDSNWIGVFILTSVFKARLRPKYHALVFNFLRRAEGACSAYRAGRLALIEYLETPPNALSPYFRALLNFELYIAECYQGLEMLKKLPGSPSL
jgi:DNA-directed RNA polymerase subunit RPC12/RpoP